MKMKKLLALVLSIVLVVSCIPAMIAGAYSGRVGTELTNPITVSPNSSGTFTWLQNDNGAAYFKFTVASAGVVTFNCQKMMNVVTGEVIDMYFDLYSAANTSSAIWSDYYSNYENVLGDYQFQWPLKAGTYIVEVDPYISLWNDGAREQMTYAFSFAPKTDWEAEPNNGATLANPLGLNKVIYGNTGGNYSLPDYYSISVTKDTPVRLYVGNYAGLYAEYLTLSLTAGGKKSYLSNYNFVKGSGNFSYIDVLLKKGTNYLEVPGENPAIQYWLKASSADIEYKAPAIKNISIKHSYSNIYTGDVSWGAVSGVDGYDVYYNESNRGWKKLGSYYGTSIYVYNIEGGKSYHLKVRGYKMFGDVKYYGEWSKTVALRTTPTNIKLSATSYTYNGKTKTPSVVIKNNSGKKLKKGTDYTVKYSSGRKKVGKYKVTITFKGNYSGTVTKTFKIVPPATSVSKVTAGSKKLTIKWKKKTSQTTGYQIQVSTSSKFKSGNKTALVKKNKTVSTTLKKLKAKKTYYVRVRTYKSVNGEKFYSNWSKAVMKKTK